MGNLQGAANLLWATNREIAQAMKASLNRRLSSVGLFSVLLFENNVIRGPRYNFASGFLPTNSLIGPDYTQMFRIAEFLVDMSYKFYIPTVNIDSIHNTIGIEFLKHT